jgi:hypothetical protein
LPLVSFIGIDNVYTCILTLSYKRDILCPAKSSRRSTISDSRLNKKQSTSLTGQEILSEALSIVDNKTAQQILNEKLAKKLSFYFKALVKRDF